jgi:hypothetical protein
LDSSWQQEVSSPFNSHTLTQLSKEQPGNGALIMDTKLTILDFLFWGILTAFVVIIGDYVFSLTSILSSTL